MSLIRTPKEEGHYTIKRVEKLPAKGNYNWLYALRTTTLDKFYRYLQDGTYEEITVGGAGSSITNTSQLINDGASGVSTYVELNGLSTVATTGDYSDLINAPAAGIQSVVAGTNVTVDNTDPLNPIVSATGAGGGISSVVGSTNIGVDNTDPNNPIVSALNLVTIDTTQTVTGQKTWTNLNTFNSSVDIRSGNLFVEDVYLNPHTPFGGTLNGRVDFGVDSTYRVYFHPEGGSSNAFLNFNGVTADREYMFQDGSGTLAFLTDIPTSVSSIVGGTNIDIDNTDVNNPIVNAVDVVNTTSAQSINGNKTFNGTTTAASFLQVNATNPAQNIFLLYPISTLGGTTLVGGASSYLITAPDGSMVWRGTANPDMVFSNQSLTERRTYTLQDGDGTLAFLSDIPAAGGQVDSIVAGTNITVDNTDPANPIVSATGGGGGGDVFKVGTPVDNQIGVWTGDGTIEGDPNFTWDGDKFVVQAAALGSASTPFTEFQLPAVAAEGIFGHVQISQPGVEGLAGLLLSSSTEDWSLAARGNIRQGTFRLGINGNTGAAAGDTAFEVSRTDFTIDAPNVTTAAIDAASATTYVTKEWVQANSGGGSAPEDTVYDATWDGNTAAASKNTIYDKIESLTVVDDSSPAVTTTVNTYWASDPTTANIDATIINDSAILVNGFISGGASIVPVIGNDYEYQGTFEVSFAGGKVPKQTAGLNFIMSNASGNPDVKIGIVTAANVGGGVTRFSVVYKVSPNINFAGFNTVTFTGLILVN